MELIVGGAAQGKRALVLSCPEISGEQLLDGAVCPLDQIPQNIQVLDKLHLLVRRLMRAELDPQTFIFRLVEENPQIILISDEIGCGVVPLEPFDRAWREQTGRICCRLAQQAERVQRVCMGISTILKETKTCESI